MVAVQRQSSGVSLTSRAGVFVVLSVDTIFIAVSITLLKQKEKNLNSGAQLGPYFPLRTEILIFFFQCTLGRLYLASADWLSGRT